MTTSVACPYCRGPIEPSTDEQVVCPGCGTPHHADCYAENAGCTVFGCTAAPAQEPKLSLSGTDLADVTSPTPAPAIVGGDSFASTLPATPARAKTAPPPPPPGFAAAPAPRPSVPRPVAGVGSMLFPVEPVPVPVQAQTAPVELDFTPNPNAKNRMTFIILGVLLGALGAHNFYAGYHRKAVGQLLITLLTLGFASPMMWVWAVIDVWTVDRDHDGIKFRS